MRMARAFKHGWFDEVSLRRSAESTGATTDHFLNCEKCGVRYILHIYLFEDAESVQSLLSQEFGRDCPEHWVRLYTIDPFLEKIVPDSN